MTKLGLFCDRLLEAGWLVAVAIVPLYFDIFSNRVFEPDKIVMLRCIVTVMALAQVVKWLESLPGPKSAMASRAIVEPGKRFSFGHPLVKPTIAVVLTYLVGTAVSITPSISLWGSYQRLQGTYSMLTYIALFLMVAVNLRDRVQIERLFTMILLVSLPISCYGVAQHFHLDPLPWGGDVTTRVTSTMGNAIFLAAYLIMVIPITLQRLIVTTRRLRTFGTVPNGQLFDGAPRVVALAAILVVEMLVVSLFAVTAPKLANLWWSALPLIGMFVALGLLFNIPRPTFFSTLVEAVGYVLLLAVQLTALFLSGSRGPWIGMMVGAAIFVIVLAARRGKRLLLRGAILTGAGLLALLVVFNLPNSPLSSFRALPLAGRLGELTDTASGTGKVRTLIWGGTMRLLATRPGIGMATIDTLGPARLLFGYGPESMYVAFNKVYPPDLAHYEARNASPDRNHNDLLDYLVNTGLAGLAAYVFLLVIAFRLLWRQLRSADDPASQAAIAALLAALTAHIIESQTGIVIAATRSYFWLYLAIAATGLLARAKDTGDYSAAQNVMPAIEVVASTGKPRRVARPAREARHPQTAVVEFPVLPYSVVFACGFVLLAIAVTLRISGYVHDAHLALVVSFSALVVVYLAIATGLHRKPSLARFCRPRHIPIYLLGGLATILVVGANLNVVAADIYFKRGFSNDDARDFQSSVPAYQEALRYAGDQDYYYLFLGRVYMELAKLTQRPNVAPPFEPTVRGLRDLSPSQLSALGREDLLNASKFSLEQARDLNPLNTDHYANLGRLYRTWGAPNDRAKLDQAAEYYRQATILSPQSAQLLDELGQVQVDQGDLDGALATTLNAQTIDPAFGWTYLLLGDIYISKGRLPDALVAHAKALAYEPAALSDARFEQRVAAYNRANMLAQVDDVYAKVVRDSPGSPAGHAAYGYVLAQEDKLDAALAQFQANARLLPRDWATQRSLAIIYKGMGKQDQALVSAQEALRLAPSSETNGLQALISELKR